MLASVVLAIPKRPNDLDHGHVMTRSFFAISSERPAHTRGKCDCCHPEVEVAFLHAGATHATIGGRSTVLRAGQYWIISGDVEHTTHTAEDGSRGTYLQLLPSFLDRVADDLGVARRRRRHTAPGPITPALRGALVALDSELTSERPAPLLVESIGQYIAGVLTRAGAEDARASALRLDRRDRRLERAVELMHSAPAQPHSLEVLAGVAGLSKFRFAHLFKSRYGVSPHRYLVRMRTRLAAERLLQSQQSVTAIALEFGFSSGSRFAHELRREHGLSPSEYRELGGSKN